MTDAELVLASSRRPLVLGIGGGGDVVGALATAEVCRLGYGARPIVGGISWERRVIDPNPGPRAAGEIENAEEIAPGVLTAGPDTGVAGTDILFAESRMAGFLGERTVLLDASLGPAALADGLEAASEALGHDLVVFVDVGGDALAHGTESGLASPLCDAVMLAAGDLLAERGVPVLGAVFGPGCDGELEPEEVLDRVAEIAAAGGLAGARGLTPTIAARLEEAVGVVPTEASAQALRCFSGETGISQIRGGLRHVPLGPVGALTFYFDIPIAVRSAARLAMVVRSATGVEHANELLHDYGVRTELDLEREFAARE